MIWIEYKYNKIKEGFLFCMNKSVMFEKCRREYKEFWYNSYKAYEDEEKIYLEYEFEIPKLTK